LRRELTGLCVERGIDLRLPDMSYCVDNAAMHAALAHQRWLRGESDDLSTTAQPTTRRKR
ncbi:MAG TPA: tRNA (adenosine(37)-N6)-threonylcarbamoyltransferase complex transferase subunit TsaD, partial [Phycisphaerales bacterium]|nr:tRNA (adenosine(37)-N6)-threonylcarbamoyltransferase complex transferase subunit TsaD [Phycisphaerales bacterium]